MPTKAELEQENNALKGKVTKMEAEKKKAVSEWEQTDALAAAADDATSEATETAEADTNTSAGEEDKVLAAKNWPWLKSKPPASTGGKTA